MMAESRQLIVNIEYLQSTHKVDNKKLAKVMGVSPATFQNRKNRPGQITFSEIERLAKFFGISPAQLIEPFIPSAITPIERN